ncbi:Hypothetical_protein [Hexamita inflata]|uniref:Hypothetical_protein n=1 Tax=Hexamita inflata TaxID=28002 RepID=A0AA86P8P0_9EUKA|nr:Hypothetical protein HINF_LOCUS21852 [Hexamita inflata]
MRSWLVDVSACTWKQMRPRRGLKMKSKEKTSEFRFQEFCKASVLIHYLSEVDSCLVGSSQVAEKVQSFLSEIQQPKQTKCEACFPGFRSRLRTSFSRTHLGPVCNNRSYCIQQAALSCFLKQIITFHILMNTNVHCYRFKT